jgi:hypothetical protein
MDVSGETLIFKLVEPDRTFVHILRKGAKNIRDSKATVSTTEFNLI